MSLLDRLLGGPMMTIHVIDYKDPEPRFTVRRRVPRRIVAAYASGGELFAVGSHGQPLKLFPGFRISGKTYHFMPKSDWDELDALARQAPRNAEEAVESMLKVMEATNRSGT